MVAASVSRAGGPLVAHATSGYARLFPSLLPWVPPGSTRAEQTAAVFALSEALYGDRPAPPADAMPAGYTFLAQFLTHDLSFDARNLPLSATVPTLNRRTPALDLDLVYGLGPDLQPYLYQTVNPALLLIGTTDLGELDLPRCPDPADRNLSERSRYRRRRAIVADPRDDENLIVGQIHLAVMRFHNARVREGASFDEARRLTRWHYQWLIVNDLLDRLCGREVLDDALGDGRPPMALFPTGVEPFVPLEFAVGAFRAGHAMVSGSYVLNDHFEGVFHSYPVFDVHSPAKSLVGGRELPVGWAIQWDRFFAVPGGAAHCQRAACLSRHIDCSLRLLPIAADDTRFKSLAFRTLLRAWQLGVPSGQAVAEAVTGSRPEGNDPLWLFVLDEALQAERGARLGRVGARIVAETVVALLAADPNSYFATDPAWEPVGAAGARYTMIDFLRAAGMPITAADWAARGR